MNNIGNSVAPAIADEDDLVILREVSNAYETFKDLRKRAARYSRSKGRTYQQLGDALGTGRSAAQQYLARDAA
jgi:hypothetical protein